MFIKADAYTRTRKPVDVIGIGPQIILFSSQLQWVVKYLAKMGKRILVISRKHSKHAVLYNKIAREASIMLVDNV